MSAALPTRLPALPTVLLLAALAAPAAGQPDLGADDRLDRIPVWYAAVRDSLPHLAQTEKAFEHPAGGGRLLLWRDASGAVRKLALEQDGDGVSHRNEYYLRDGALFFALEIRETQPIWEEQEPEDFGRDEDRFYLDGARLLRWLATRHADAGRQMIVDPGEHGDRGDLLLRRVALLEGFAADPGSDLYAWDVDGIAFQ